MAKQHPSKDDKFLEQLYQIIGEHLGDENFNAEELALLIGLSRTTLHRRLSKLTGTSIRETISRQRVQRAMELLKADAGTVSEIAYMVGFNDPSYFNKVFKKYYKISPGKVKAGNKRNISLNRKRYWLASALFLLFVTFIVISRPGMNNETSIAILPLHNFTGNTENDYLIDGLHDALVA